MFNSMYKYSCLSIYAEAWLWHWGKRLPYEKVSITFHIKLFTWNPSCPVIEDKKEDENSNILISDMFLVLSDCYIPVLEAFYNFARVLSG